MSLRQAVIGVSLCCQVLLDTRMFQGGLYTWCPSSLFEVRWGAYVGQQFTMEFELVLLHHGKKALMRLKEHWWMTQNSIGLSRQTWSPKKSCNSYDLKELNLPTQRMRQGQCSVSSPTQLWMVREEIKWLLLTKWMLTKLYCIILGRCFAVVNREEAPLGYYDMDLDDFAPDSEAGKQQDQFLAISHAV